MNPTPTTSSAARPLAVDLGAGDIIEPTPGQPVEVTGAYRCGANVVVVGIFIATGDDARYHFSPTGRVAVR